jgi:N-acyl homoserine lactone hydrolase
MEKLITVEAVAVRLYILDGGFIRGYDASDLADDGAYDGRRVDLPAPCFLIRHPDGDLMWDSGISETRTNLGRRSPRAQALAHSWPRSA